MQSVEISAKSLDEAKKNAAEKLGVSPKDLKVTVIEESKGLFGKASVKIRAEAPEPKAAKAPKASAKSRSAPAPVAEAEPEPEQTPEPEEKRKPARSRAKKAGAEPPQEEVAKAAPAEADEERDQDTPDATQADANELAELVREVLGTADLEVTVNVRGFQGRYVNLEIDGRDVAFLIGKHGEVLNAMQYLVNIIAGRKKQNGIRATLDGNNYRVRREEALTGLATKIAEQVRKRGEEAVLDALPAFERRIVHKALSEIKGISTYSEGEEPNRRVVIAPAE